MRIFRVYPNLTAWRTSNYPVFEGLHRWKLPSLRCPTCQTVKGMTSVAYPYIDLAHIPNVKIYKGTSVCVMSPGDLAAAKQPIAAFLPPGSPLPPGTLLGRFSGRHTAGNLEDFNLYSGLHLISRDAYERLRNQGALSVGATPALIRPKSRGKEVGFLELHLVPRAELGVPKVQEPGQKYCPICDFDQRSLPEPLVIRTCTVPPNEELFQLKDDSGVILAKAEFVQAVRSLGLTGIEFKPVETT